MLSSNANCSFAALINHDGIQHPNLVESMQETKVLYTSLKAPVSTGRYHSNAQTRGAKKLASLTLLADVAQSALPKPCPGKCTEYARPLSPPFSIPFSTPIRRDHLAPTSGFAEPQNPTSYHHDFSAFRACIAAALRCLHAGSTLDRSP